MPIPDLERQTVDSLLTRYCDGSDIPERARSMVRFGYRIDGMSVVLYESRPYFKDHSQWLDHDVAKFRYVTSRREWELFCLDRHLHWHRYQPRPAAKKFKTLLDEVEADPTCIFWG